MAYFKVMCEGLSADDLSAALCQTIRDNRGRAWSTTLPGISALRIDLLRRQKFRCAYCQTHISDNLNGLREIDHVLPKKRTKDLNPDVVFRSTISARAQTLGYPVFTFEPLNLVITCKQCNTNKSQFDPLEVRGLNPPSDYPTWSGSFRWIHPYFDKYSDHIRITDHRLYVKVTKKGWAVIKACKLDEAETLNRSIAAEAFGAKYQGIADALDGFSSPSCEFHKEEVLDVLEAKFPSVPRIRAEEVLDIFRAAKSSKNSEEIRRAFDLAYNLEVEFGARVAEAKAEVD